MMLGLVAYTRKPVLGRQKLEIADSWPAGELQAKERCLKGGGQCS